MKANSKSKISRRSLLKSGVAASTAAAAGTLGAPMIWAQSNIVLRQSGTGVSAFNEIAAKAKEDLGITMEMTALDSDSVVQKVATQPKAFDIADIEYWMVKKFGQLVTYKQWIQARLLIMTKLLVSLKMVS